MIDEKDEFQLSEKTILLQLRESAMTNSNDQYRATARDCADHLSLSLDRFYKNPTFSNLEDVNGLTALAHRIMSKLQPRNDPSGRGGAMKQETYEKLRVAA